MKKKTMAIIGAATAVVLVGGAAVAKFGPGGHRGAHGGKFMMKMLASADTDGDKAISTAEFKTFIDGYFQKADANKDNKITRAEIVSAIEEQAKGKRMARHAGRLSDRVVNRFDINGDGVVEKTEIDSRTGKLYALADWNDDGKVDREELRRTRRDFGGMGRKGHGGMGGKGWRGHHRKGGQMQGEPMKGEHMQDGQMDQPQQEKPAQ